MFNGKYISLIYTVALQVYCAYTVALKEYYTPWLGVVKQRGIPRTKTLRGPTLEIIEYDENIKHIEC